MCVVVEVVVMGKVVLSRTEILIPSMKVKPSSRCLNLMRPRHVPQTMMRHEGEGGLLVLVWFRLSF